MGDHRRSENAYMRHLLGKLSDDLVTPPEKPVIGRHQKESLTPKAIKMLVVCALLMVACLVLMAWSFGSSPTPTADPEIQLEAADWARSGVRSPIFQQLRNVHDASFPQESLDSTFLGGQRWKVSGTLLLVDSQGESHERKWAAEIEYSPELKTGQIVSVYLDDVLIYSNLSVGNED